MVRSFPFIIYSLIIYYQHSIAYRYLANDLRNNIALSFLRTSALNLSSNDPKFNLNLKQLKIFLNNV
jgi:hypothetical protein